MKKILIFSLPVLALCLASCKKDKVDTWRDDSPIIDFNDTRLLKALIEISDMYGDYPHSDGNRVYRTFKDMNGDGKVSEKEASRVQYLDLSGYKIRNFDEIVYFSSLEILYCQNNELKDIDISKNTGLKDLNCMGNSLTALDVSKNSSLESLSCKLNELTSLDVSGCSRLKSLSCENNKLTRLVISGCGSLEELNCSSNSISTIDVSECTELKELDCSYNEIKTLDLSNNKYLESVTCHENPLDAIILYEYADLPETFLETYRNIIKGYQW